MKNSSITVQEEGMLAVSTTGNWCSVFGNREFTDGILDFEVSLDSLSAVNRGCFLLD